MSDAESTVVETEKAAYDPAEIQQRWLPVWDEIAPFRSGDPSDERPTKYVLDMFPYPSGGLAYGPCGGLRARRRGFAILGAAWQQRPAPHRMGCVRFAR